MKSIQWVLIASLVLPFPAFGQQAQVLPGFLEQELGTAAAGTAFQLEANKTVEAVSSEANYRDRIHYQVERDLKGFNEVVKSSMGISAVAAMGGFFGSIAGVGGGPHGPHDSSAESASSKKFDVGAEDLLLSSMGTFFGGGLASAALGALLQKDQMKIVLNESKADEYSASVAKMFGKIFKLNAAKESALKFAIREEIYKKSKAGDETSLDIFKILSETKHAGKNIVTPAEAATLAELKKKDEKDGNAAPAEKDKVLFLLTGKRFLKEQLKLGKLKDEEANKVRNQVAYNDAIIARIAEYRVASGQSKGDVDEGAKEGAAE